MLSTLVTELLTGSPLLALPVLAMLVFLGVFLAVGVRAVRLGRADVDRMARLPLEADDE